MDVTKRYKGKYDAPSSTNCGEQEPPFPAAKINFAPLSSKYYQTTAKRPCTVGECDKRDQSKCKRKTSPQKQTNRVLRETSSTSSCENDCPESPEDCDVRDRQHARRNQPRSPDRMSRCAAASSSDSASSSVTSRCQADGSDSSQSVSSAYESE